MQNIEQLEHFSVIEHATVSKPSPSKPAPSNPPVTGTKPGPSAAKPGPSKPTVTGGKPAPSAAKPTPSKPAPSKPAPLCVIGNGEKVSTVATVNINEDCICPPKRNGKDDKHTVRHVLYEKDSKHKQQWCFTK